jgi:hypothetical protein
MAETPGFFSREAGLARRRALDDYLNEAADYYLGPTGIPDRLRAVNEFFNPVAAMEEASLQATRAADPERSVEERLEALAAAGVNTATFGLPALLGMMRAVPKDQALIQMLLGGGPDPSGATAGRAVAESDAPYAMRLTGRDQLEDMFGAAAPKATTPNQPAIIRPDDVYRGEGTPRITVRQTDQPFVVRGTQQSQIDDMIQSGLVRPKPGGYSKRNRSQLYFGESSEAMPTSAFERPTEDRFVIVGDSDKLAGTEGPIPIDQLRHVWVVRNGETVDVLPEILRANRDFDNAGQ